MQLFVHLNPELHFLIGKEYFQFFVVIRFEIIEFRLSNLLFFIELQVLG